MGQLEQSRWTEADIDGGAGAKAKGKDKDEDKDGDADKDDDLDSLQPVPYWRLFRYATRGELALSFVGLLCGVVTGLSLPVMVVLYGEFTTLLVDRHLSNTTSSATSLLCLFGGGRVLEGAAWEERRAALLEDGRAFALGALVDAILQFAFAVASVTCLNRSAQAQVGRIRRLFLRALLRQEMGWFDRRNPSALATRLTEDLDKLQEGVGERVGVCAYLAVTFLAGACVSLAHGWRLTLAVLGAVPLLAGSTALVAQAQSSLAAKEQRAYGAAGAAAAEALQAHRTVLAFAGEDKEAQRYAGRLRAAERVAKRRGLLSGVGGGGMWLMLFSIYGLAVWYGVHLVLQGECTPAAMIIALFGVLAGALNLGLAAPHVEAFGVACGAAAGVFALLERAPRVDALSEDGRKPAQPPRGDLELRDVHFRYPARPQAPVLRGLDLKVPAGATVALVGGSGCGKSTVVQLLQRLYDVDHGQVLLDGEDVAELNVAWLRGQLGVVQQEPALFAVSVADNIRLGCEGASQADVEAAAKLALAHDFIVRLPQGYDTLVGERGAQLSGGQKQRVAIARALVRDPRVLLLDEATSALDGRSEALVQRALERAARGRTTLVVAHRLATVAGADRIVCLADGRVAEEGTHAELLARRGHYYALVRAEAEAQAQTQALCATPAPHSHGETRPHDEEREAAAGAEAGDASADATQRVEPSGRPDVLPLADPVSPSSTPPPSSSGEDITHDKLTKVVGDTGVDGKEEQEEEMYPAPFKRILSMNRPEFPLIAVGCVAAILAGTSIPFFAVIFGEVYKALSLEEAAAVEAAAGLYGALLVGVGALAGGGVFAQLYLFGVAGARLTTRLRLRAFRALLRQDGAFFDDPRHSAALLCARLSADAAAVQGATGPRIGSLLQATSTLALGVLMSLYLSWKLTLVTALSVPLIFVGVTLESRVMSGGGGSGGDGLRAKRAMESASRVALEAAGSVRAVAALGAEAAFARRYEGALAEAERAARGAGRWRGAAFALGQCSWAVAYALSLYYGSRLVALEGLPYESVIKIAEAHVFGTWMLAQSLALAPNFASAKLSAGRIFALLDRRPRVVSPDGAHEGQGEGARRGRVHFEGVRFAYPSRPDAAVLRGLDLKVPAGATVALVGRSGCGKSTCLQLLQRLYDPDAGCVRVDGRATTALALGPLRARLGVVSQEPVLFDRSIAENIAYGDNSRAVPMHEIIAAAKAAHLHTFVAALPQGYDTLVGERGAQLSGGQKQRVAIARALVRDPRVLLLDEATSALDSQSERVVQKALDDASKGRTCIVIAHRLATVQQADLICVVKHGQIAEMGTHNELLEKKGLYFELCQQGNSL